MQDMKAKAGVSTGSASCVPRAAAAQEETGDCDITCSASPDLVVKFKSLNTNIDYMQYCVSECSTVGQELNVLCVPLNEAKEVMEVSFESAAPGPSPGPVPVQALPMPTLAGTAALPPPPVIVTAAPPAGGPPVGASMVEVALAEQEMNRARAQAISAGQAARAARMAYEQVAKTSATAADLAAAAALKQLQLIAGQQADLIAQGKAMYIREGRANASKVAFDAAMVYKSALDRDMLAADKYDQRGWQLQQAAKARRQLAAGIAAEVAFHKQPPWGAGPESPSVKEAREAKARDISANEQRAEEEASILDARSAAARTEALSIRNRTEWYDHAEKQAYVSALMKALPPNVPPPTALPILPGMITTPAPVMLPGMPGGPPVLPGMLPGLAQDAPGQPGMPTAPPIGGIAAVGLPIGMDGADPNAGGFPGMTPPGMAPPGMAPGGMAPAMPYGGPLLGFGVLPGGIPTDTLLKEGLPPELFLPGKGPLMPPTVPPGGMPGMPMAPGGMPGMGPPAYR